LQNEMLFYYGWKETEPKTGFLVISNNFSAEL